MVIVKLSNKKQLQYARCYWSCFLTGVKNLRFLPVRFAIFLPVLTGGVFLRMDNMIPDKFRNYYNTKLSVGETRRRSGKMIMTLEQCWSVWEPYWQDRLNKRTNPNGYVLARLGDTGDYTLENCRCVRNNENVWERVVNRGMNHRTRYEDYRNSV